MSHYGIVKQQNLLLLPKTKFSIFFRISGGELFERVIDDDFILTERLCELYTMQICEGVNFMHSCNIIHLDMKVCSDKFLSIVDKRLNFI